MNPHFQIETQKTDVPLIFYVEFVFIDFQREYPRHQSKNEIIFFQSWTHRSYFGKCYAISFYSELVIDSNSTTFQVILLRVMESIVAD